MNTNTQRLFYSTACPTIVTRAQCNLRAPSGTADTLSRPVPTAVIHHGESETSCTTQAECCTIVRAYQNYHMDDNGWIDIGFNFLVGEDGSVYEGRGWASVGAHAAGCNTKSIGICYIGDFTSKPICTVYLHDTYSYLNLNVSRLPQITLILNCF